MDTKKFLEVIIKEAEKHSEIFRESQPLASWLPEPDGGVHLGIQCKNGKCGFYLSGSYLNKNFENILPKQVSEELGRTPCLLDTSKILDVFANYISKNSAYQLKEDYKKKLMKNLS